MDRMNRLDTDFLVVLSDRARMGRIGKRTRRTDGLHDVVSLERGEEVLWESSNRVLHDG
jgi:hypothetical protein